MFICGSTYMSSPGGLGVKKKSACNAGDLSLTPGWEDPLEKGMATQYSYLENSMDKGSLAS